MKNKIIFSAELSSLTTYQNNVRTKSLEISLNNLEVSFKRVLGSYKGSSEVSFIVDIKHMELVQTVMKVFNQESILVLDSKGQASLKFQNNNVLNLNGVMSKVEVSEVPNLEAWTKVNNEFFTIKAA